MQAFTGDMFSKEQAMEMASRDRETDRKERGIPDRETGRKERGILDNYQAWESMFGIPRELGMAVDTVMWNLQEDEARAWPRDFMETVPTGKDLSGTLENWFLWLTSDPQGPMGTRLEDPWVIRARETVDEWMKAGKTEPGTNEDRHQLTARDIEELLTAARQADRTKGGWSSASAARASKSIICVIDDLDGNRSRITSLPAGRGGEDEEERKLRNMEGALVLSALTQSSGASRREGDPRHDGPIQDAWQSISKGLLKAISGG